MASGFVRGLLLIVLGLGVAGFGICSLCGGVMGVAMFVRGQTELARRSPGSRSA